MDELDSIGERRLPHSALYVLLALDEEWDGR